MSSEISEEDFVFIFRVSCLVYSSTMKMEKRSSSETQVDSQRTARRYISQDGTFEIICIDFLLSEMACNV
jgi:hypothetical protein